LIFLSAKDAKGSKQKLFDLPSCFFASFADEMIF